MAPSREPPLPGAEHSGKGPQALTPERPQGGGGRNRPAGVASRLRMRVLPELIFLQVNLPGVDFLNVWG